MPVTYQNTVQSGCPTPLRPPRNIGSTSTLPRTVKPPSVPPPVPLPRNGTARVSLDLQEDYLTPFDIPQTQTQEEGKATANEGIDEAVGGNTDNNYLPGWKRSLCKARTQPLPSIPTTPCDNGHLENGPAPPTLPKSTRFSASTTPTPNGHLGSRRLTECNEENAHRAPTLPRRSLGSQSFPADDTATHCNALNETFKKRREELKAVPSTVDKETPVATSSRIGPPVSQKPQWSVQKTRMSLLQDSSEANESIPAAKLATDELERQPWYFGNMTRKECENRLMAAGVNGGFVVRRSCRGGECNPYALTCFHKQAVYNLLIRQKSDNTFALGSEKPDENVFSDVVQLINFHRLNPVKLQNNDHIKLTSCPPK